jgi:hypothetical protein
MSDNGHLPLTPTVMALAICVFVQYRKDRKDNTKPWQKDINKQIKGMWVTMRSTTFCYQ